jgi:beta-lactamase class D
LLPQTGWYVGYLETAQDVWLFATNIVIRNQDDLPLRQQLTKEKASSQTRLGRQQAGLLYPESGMLSQICG